MGFFPSVCLGPPPRPLLSWAEAATRSRVGKGHKLGVIGDIRRGADDGRSTGGAAS
jgi:hypothetical protein